MKGWVVAAAVLGLLFWLMSKGKAAAGLARGAIQGISIDGVPMGTHQVVKRVGGTQAERTVTVTVNWTGSTKNSQGAGISWRYRVLVQVTGPQTVVTAFPSGTIISGFLVNQSTPVTFELNQTVLGLYSVVAVLQAENSDPQGNPTGFFNDIPGVTMTHTDAISLVQAGGPATPQGAIGAVDVAQAILGQMNG